MLTVLPVALVLLAASPAVAGENAVAAPSNGSSAPEAPAAKPPSAPPAVAAAPAASAQPCATQSSNDRQIIICTQRTEGYRLNPDVMEAKREVRSGGRPPRPNGSPPPDCRTVGPAPCFNAGINLIAAAATAAEMAARLAKGQEIGSMFITDPHPSEYQLYQMAKARREARDAEKAAAQKAKAAKVAAAPAPAPAPAPPPAPAPAIAGRTQPASN